MAVLKLRCSMGLLQGFYRVIARCLSWVAGVGVAGVGGGAGD